MKIYSDTLSTDDLYAALPDRVHLDGLCPITRPRVRRRGWIVKLTGTSTRHRNSGSYGAASWESTPATWDEHGQWMARLYELDPEARITYYANRDQFHAMTKNAYRVDWTS